MQNCNYKEDTGKIDKNRQTKIFFLDALKLFRISGGDGIPNYRGILQPRPD
jgi:hypothetical protein